MNISILKQVRNENFCLYCIANCVEISNYFDCCVVALCMTRNDQSSHRFTHVKKVLSCLSLKKNTVYSTEKIRRPRLRQVQNFAPSPEIDHFLPLLHNVLFPA